MHLEEFAEGKSLIHSLDPRIKLLGFFPFIIVTAVAKELVVPVIALVIGIILLFLSRLNFKSILKRLFAVNLFILFLWVILPFSVQGRSILTIGPFTATSEGIFYTLSITLKANAIVLSTITLASTIPIFQLVHALIHLKIPEKLVNLFFFCYRYISVLHDEYTVLRNSMKVRGFKPSTNLHTYRSYAYLIATLIIKSYEHSQKIYQAMLCRGFKGRFPALYHFTNLVRNDCVFIVSMILITGCMLLIEIGRLFGRTL